VESESEEEEQAPAATSGPASKYMRGEASDSDSDDDGKRVVRSARDKRFDELQQTYDQMKNQMKINDWVSLQSSFEKLNKQLEKVARLTEGEPTPRLYIKAVAELEDFMVSWSGECGLLVNCGQKNFEHVGKHGFRSVGLSTWITIRV
jgi:translation initiation factor 3 subunit C